MKHNLKCLHENRIIFAANFKQIMNNNMNKKVISIVAAVLMGLTAQAQVQPKVLGENHAMVRLEKGNKYVLLPVEEKAENASVRVIGKDNQCVRRPNVRLAVDHADYYVPLEIKDGQVLDIDPSEITLGGKAADATKTNDYVTFTLASDDNAKYESNVVALEMEDGFKATFALNINVYKSQQGDIGAGGSGGGVTEQWVQDYVSAETSAFVTDTEMGTAISNATTDMATQTWVGSQGFATTSYVDAQIGTVLSTNF